jgi:glucosylceramidase
MKPLLIAGLAIILTFFVFARRADARSQMQNRSAPTIAARAGSNIRMIVTSADKKFAEQSPLSWSAASSAGESGIAIDGSKKYQDILGFGAAFTDAACYMINELPADAREKLMKDLFSPDSLGLNVNRVCMGASDYATHLYSYDDGDEPDPDLKRFSIAHDEKYILPVIKQARQFNPDIFLFASPWSPPGWMKANKSMLGGSMRQFYFPSYAQYFVKFIKGYEAQGVPVQAVTVQNEVDTDQDGRMPACLWPQEYEVGFIAHHLGPAFEKDGLKTKIWFIDHNYNLWGRAQASLEDENFRKYAEGIAWHGYVGDAAKITDVHNAFPKINMYWTEGGPDISDPNYAVDWAKWGKSFTGNLRNWCRSITAWNFALDEEGKPNIGPFPCGGVVTIDKKTKEIRHSGQYYALGHFSKYVKRGAKRIDSSASLADVEHIAFENPDGQRVAVITNAGAARSVSMHDGDNAVDIKLEPNSVTTLLWE